MWKEELMNGKELSFLFELRQIYVDKKISNLVEKSGNNTSASKLGEPIIVNT